MIQRPICWLAAVCAASVLATAAPARAEDAVPAALQVRLLGTVKSPRGGIALCLDPATGRSFSLKIGEKFAGWNLRSIHDGEAIFVNESSFAQTIIRMSSPANGVIFTPPPRPPAAAAPAPAQPSQALAVPTGTWKDGDGQMISPPRK